MTGSSENISEPNKNQKNNILVEERGSWVMSQNYLRRRKRTCGCISAIQISTPKHTVYAHGIGPFTCKEQVFQDTLKNTRKERTRSNLESMNNFWENFK